MLETAEAAAAATASSKSNERTMKAKCSSQSPEKTAPTAATKTAKTSATSTVTATATQATTGSNETPSSSSKVKCALSRSSDLRGANSVEQSNNNNYHYYNNNNNGSRTASCSTIDMFGGGGGGLMGSASVESLEAADFDGLYYKDASNVVQTMKMLNVLRRNRQLCDLILQLDDDSQDIYCHQNILACNSKFFMEIFNNYELEQSTGSKLADGHHDDNDHHKQQQQQHDDSSCKAGKNGKSSSSKSSSPVASSGNSEETTTHGDAAGRKKKKQLPLQAIVNTNHNSTQRQLLFCLSDYLRNFLSDNYHHHYARINSAVNHNSHYHHYHHHHPNNLNHHIDSGVSTTSDDASHQMNQSLDYEALKICVDFMYTSTLRVPSYLLPHVYTLAYHLSFDSVVAACGAYLTRHLNVDNCLSIRSFALDEQLIDASAQCIDKNIEYILQLGGQPQPASSSSISSSSNYGNGNNLASSNSSLASSGGLESHANQQSNLLTTDSLSSSLNLAHKEFNHLPRINIELVGLESHKSKLPDSLGDLTALCMSWLVDELVEKRDLKLSDLCDNLNMLYMNKRDLTLHDCCDLDSSDTNFTDYINDYQKQHNAALLASGGGGGGSSGSGRTTPNGGGGGSGILRRANSRNTPPMHASGSAGGSASSNSRLKTFRITDQELNAIGTATPIRVKVLHDNESICAHQTGESSFIAICMLNGKLVSLSVHILPSNQNVNGHGNSDSHVNGDSVVVTNSAGSNAAGGASQVDSSSSSSLQLNGRQDSPRLLLLVNGQQEPGADLVGKLSDSGSLSPNLDHQPQSGSSSSSSESQFSLDQQNNSGAYQNAVFKRSVSTYSNSNNNNNNNNIGSIGSSSSSSVEALERLPKMSVARCSHGVVAHADRLYIIGGYDRGECLSVCEAYDPARNRIERLEGMRDRRGRAAITWVERPEQAVYVLGGSDGHEDLNSIEYYSVAQRAWRSIKFDFDLGCTNLGACACDSFIYLVGLKGDGGKSLARSSCLRYEPASNAFSRMAELNNGRSQSALVCDANGSGNGGLTNSDNPMLYVFGGHDQIRCLSSCEVYSVREDKWSVIAPMHEPRRGCGAAVHRRSGAIYIVGGTNGSHSLKSVEVYDTRAKRWTSGPDLTVARTNVAIAFIGDILFAVGGFDGKTFLKSIEYLNCAHPDSGWSMYHKAADFEFLTQQQQQQPAAVAPAAAAI